MRRLEEFYPFHSHFFETRGHRLHYIDEGRGDAVVMVHGNPTWSFLYRRFVKNLSARYRVIALDHIGCGLSDKPSKDQYPYTLKTRIDDLEALLEHLGVNKDVTLFVHDWGGFIGFGYATRHPGSIRRLVVFNSAAFRIPQGVKLPWALAICRVPFLGALLVRGFNAFAGIAARFYIQGKSRSGAPAKEISATRYFLRAPYDSWKNRVAVHEFVRDIPVTASDRSYPLAKEIEDKLMLLREKPLMICWGEGDFVFNDRILREWCRHFPSAEVHRLKGAGHYVTENASAEVERLTNAFLAGRRRVTAGGTVV